MQAFSLSPFIIQKIMKKLLLLLSLLALPLTTLGLDISQLDATLTRTEADATFSKDYDFTVLSDISIRREWNLTDYYLQLDFNISTDKLIMAQIRYKTPINSKIAIADAVKMAGIKLPTWKKAKPAQAKSIGLGDCFYTKTEDNRYFFVEVNGNNNALSTIFFSSAPKVNRRALSEANTQGYSAMGRNVNADAASVLYEDELARLSDDSSSTQASSKSTKTKPSNAKTPTSLAKNETSTLTLAKVEKSSENSLSRGEIVGLGALVLLAIIIMVFASRKKHHLSSSQSGVPTLKK